MQSIALAVSIALTDGFVGSREPVTITDAARSSFADVVALSLADHIYCTATMLSASHGLTAAHCIALRRPDVHTFDGGELARVAEVAVHPDFDAATLAHDLAMFRLEQPLAAGDGVELEQDGAPRAGDDLIAVGFGYDGRRWGQQHAGTVRVTDVGDATLQVEPHPQSLCTGDSGAPAFATSEVGARRLVGVTSSGDAACEDHGRLVRVDAEADVIATLWQSLEPAAHGCAVGGRPRGGEKPLALAVALCLLGHRRRLDRRARGRRRRCDRPRGPWPPCGTIGPP